MNETLRNIKSRRSIRKFKNDEVPQELIEMIVEAGTYSASGKNAQAPIILVVKDKKKREEFSKINARIGGKQEGFDPFYGAPVILVVLAKKSVSTAIYDGSLVMGNLMLAAHSLGLGSIWIHRAKEEFEDDFGKNILKELGIEEEYIGIGHCAIGYIDGEYPKASKRKDNWIYYLK